MLYVTVRIMVKWLNSPYPNSLTFWENRYFIMVSEQEILNLILVSTLPPILNAKNPTCWAPLTKGEFRLTSEREC